MDTTTIGPIHTIIPTNMATITYTATPILIHTIVLTTTTRMESIPISHPGVMANR
jgi:hypothetical protein